MLNINAGILADLPIALPPLPIQRRIAAILSDYDSAIENARRQIALLEEAAMRLYREWFGDGKGERKPLGEFIEITTSGSWGTDTKTVKTPNEVVCIRGADFEEIHGRSLGKQIRRFISDKHLVERSLKDGDLVVEMSGGSPTQSTGRVVSIRYAFSALWRACVGDKFLQGGSPEERLFALFVFGMARSLCVKNHVQL